jgi:hypothetical protein
LKDLQDHPFSLLSIPYKILKTQPESLKWYQQPQTQSILSSILHARKKILNFYASRSNKPQPCIIWSSTYSHVCMMFSLFLRSQEVKKLFRKLSKNIKETFCKVKTGFT